MTRPTTAAVRGALRQVRWAGWLLGVLLLLIATVAVLGGFTRSAPVNGPRVAPGESIELARYRVVVERIELVDVDGSGYETDPTLQVFLQATTTGDRTADGLSYGMLALVADGRRLPEGYARDVDGWDSTLDPDVPRPIRYAVDWTTGAPPTSLRVLLFDERPSQNFADDTASLSVDTSHPAAVVAAPVRDLRKRR